MKTVVHDAEGPRADMAFSDTRSGLPVGGPSMGLQSGMGRLSVGPAWGFGWQGTGSRGAGARWAAFPLPTEKSWTHTVTVQHQEEGLGEQTGPCVEDAGLDLGGLERAV